MAILTSVYDVESNIETTLYSSISPTATTGIVLNTVLTITKGVLSFETNGAIEYVSFGGAVVASGRTTLSDVRRNLTTTLNDFSAISATGLQHVAGITIVKLVNYHALYNLKAGIAQANTFSANQTISGTNKLFFNDTDTWIYDDGTDLKFRSSAQAEVSLATLASAAGVNDKAKVSAADTTEGYLDSKITAGLGLSKVIVNPAGNEELDLRIDLSDGNIFSATPSVGKAALYDADGNLRTASLAATSTAKEAITDKDVLVTDASGRLARADSDALVTTFPLAGVATAAAAAENDTVNYVPMGSIVEIPSISLAEYANGILTALTPTNTTENTDTDVQNSADDWRAQTFTASANAWENNVGSVTLKLTKTGAPTGNATLKLLPVVAGIPGAIASQTDGSTVPATMTAAAQWRAQTFKSAYSLGITSVKLLLTKTETGGNGNMSVTINSVSGGLPTATVLGTSANVASSGAGAGYYVEFTFASPVAITAATEYAIVFKNSNAGSSSYVDWHYANTDVYADGQSATSANSGATWTAEASYDRAFIIHAGLASSVLAYASIATGLNTFNFSVPIEITPGEQYAIVLDPGPGVSGAAYIAWDYQNTDVYAGGNSLTSADWGITWTAEATFDRYFSMQYRSINGLPVFVSTAVGAITLAPATVDSGDYNQRIGYVVDRTHISLERGLKSVYATYTFTADAIATVETEITIGFRPMLVFASAHQAPASPVTIGSMGMWMNEGASMSLENKGSFVSSNATTQFLGYHTNGLLYFDNDTNAAGANNIYVQMSVTSSSANTLTIKRVVTEEGTSSMTPYIYLNIIGF